jgi:hypothetical protein
VRSRIARILRAARSSAVSAGMPSTCRSGDTRDRAVLLAGLTPDLQHHPDRPLTQLVRILPRPPPRTCSCHAPSSPFPRSGTPAEPRPIHPADIERFVDGALLVDAWDDLVLPTALRAAWHPLIDAARSDG